MFNTNDTFVFPTRAKGGCALLVNVLGTPTLAYFKEDNPTDEKVEAVRSSMEAVILANGNPLYAARQHRGYTE